MTVLNPASINDLLQTMLDVGCACLADTPAGTPSNCFISHNEPPADCCDALSIWVDRLRPRIGFSGASYVTGEKVWAKCGDVGAVADISMRLDRPCFPTLVENAFNPFPGAAVMQAASESLLIDLQVFRCCFMAAACGGLIFPSDQSCLEIAYGDITPHGPEGGCAGWVFTYTVELDECWVGE